MCTVTYIPTTDGCIITSNRDEKIIREKAIPPQEYDIDGKKVIFPKDSKAGGTWIAHTKEKIIVLLNGAKEKHISKSHYRKSRGLVVLELITAKNSENYWEEIDLTNIEPFTIVLFERTKLLYLQWDEIVKTKKELDSTQKYIWSSATLYTTEAKNQREKWFADFINTRKNIQPSEIVHFHQFTKQENKEFGLQINRNNQLKTLSITQCFVTSNNILMTYLDLLE